MPELFPEQEQIQKRNSISQTGKTLEEILPYLISGDPDDFNFGEPDD